MLGIDGFWRPLVVAPVELQAEVHSCGPIHGRQ